MYLSECKINLVRESFAVRGDIGLLGDKADGRGFGEPVASHRYHHVPLCPIICQQHSAKMGRFFQVDINLVDLN